MKNTNTKNETKTTLGDCILNAWARTSSPNESIANTKAIILLGREDSLKAEKLLADKSLDYLSAWEPGCYRALTVEGDDLGFVHCSPQVAEVVNRMLCR